MFAATSAVVTIAHSSYSAREDDRPAVDSYRRRSPGKTTDLALDCSLTTT